MMPAAHAGARPAPMPAADQRGDARCISAIEFRGRDPGVSRDGGVPTTLRRDRPTVDWRTVEAWTAQLLVNDLRDIRDAFASRGAFGPAVIWSPNPSVIELPELRSLYEQWNRGRDRRFVPPLAQIDLEAMLPGFGYVLALDVLDGGADFRYRLFGRKAAAMSGFDMTGHLLSEHPASPYVVHFALAIYRAAMQRREPALTFYGPARALDTDAWHRLALPLADASGAVCRFISGSVPVDRAGRILEPNL